MDQCGFGGAQFLGKATQKYFIDVRPQFMYMRYFLITLPQNYAPQNPHQF